MTTPGRADDRGVEGPDDAVDVGVVVMVDVHGVVAGWSTGSERLLGFSADEAVGRNAESLLKAPELAPKALAAAVEHQGTAPPRCLLSLRHRDGHDLRVLAGVTRLLAPPERAYWLVTGTQVKPWSRQEPSTAFHEDFFAQSPVAMAVLDDDLRYVWVNSALERGGGVPREQAIGRRWGELQPELALRTARYRMRRVLDTGKPEIDHVYHGRVRRDPFRERAFSMSAFRLQDTTSGKVGVGFMALDVTDRWQARRRLALLNEVGARLGRTLDPWRTAQEVCDAIVPGLADCCTVDLWDWAVHGRDPVRDPIGGAATLIRAGQQCVRLPCPYSVVPTGDTVRYASPSPVEESQTTGHAVLTSGSEIGLAAPEARGGGPQAGSGSRTGSAMVVPLRVSDTALGVAILMRHERQDPFEHDDLLLAEEIMARGALCLENARRYVHEHSIAVTLQRSLLPYRLAEETTLDIASRYLPADAGDGVGGDWFDVIPLSGARTALVVGDVTGHGIQAAATMGRLRTAVHTLAAMDLPPDELLARLDDLVLRLAEHTPPGTESLGATCLCLVYDPTNRRCTMASAGHPSPVLIGPGGAVTVPELPPGPPLGVGGLPFENTEIELADGTLIALYTDGLLHADADADKPTVDRLIQDLTPADRPLDLICEGVINSLPLLPPSDDVALLIARTQALGTDRIVQWELPRDPAIVSHARALATEQLHAWGLDELQMTTELIVSELVTNAIRYGAGSIRLRLICHQTLICETSDESSTAPHLRHARTTDEGGRGLFLIAQLSRRWGTRPAATGKTIWTEQELPPAPEPAKGWEIPGI
ncbi:SpoIIE family protein phosphatase [Streptomyces olivoreticuli]|uniref:SpoIIE family protein phosphatase n=1 Tax=Streptomyces olivoreticuli TaxID=68246 RepID=UPI002659A4C6|nr:SpoIIE family protein phosphatase [Streptomyces olivoreticuli]WKK24325.1 SpoIIE family protein phosphatase [Streptomyces olivoreticuli]